MALKNRGPDRHQDEGEGAQLKEKKPKNPVAKSIMEALRETAE
jgi:hypothetical protein